MGVKISASLMCVDFADLRGSIRELEDAGIDYMHFDIMDGRFVPNFALGPDFLRAVRDLTDVPFDVHLMVYEPERHIGLFPVRAGDILSVHAEATVHLQRTLQAIKDTGATPAVVLNPATPVCVLDHVLDDIGVVLVMTVNPGFAGQKLVPSTLEKIGRTRRYLDSKGHHDIRIEADGNVSLENAVKMRMQGADILVAGTSSLFVRGRELSVCAKELYTAVNGGVEQ